MGSANNSSNTSPKTIRSELVADDNASIIPIIPPRVALNLPPRHLIQPVIRPSLETMSTSVRSINETGSLHTDSQIPRTARPPNVVTSADYEDKPDEDNWVCWKLWKVVECIGLCAMLGVMAHSVFTE